MKKIKTFEDACKALNVNPAGMVLTYDKDETLSGELKAIMALSKLLIITRALNEGWVPDWKNTDQWKYYPWFNMSPVSLTYVGCSYGSSSVSSRLCFEKREVAEYAAKQFKKLYKEYFIIE